MKSPSKKTIVAKVKNIYKIYHLDNGNTHTALNNVSFNIQVGDRIGILGNNGAGKTTLLKIICGMTKPTSGTVEAKGKIVALMDLEAGFNPDLSGRENIMVNGLMLGMSKADIRSKFDAIIQYSEIGKYIDQPYYTYSNGMKFRLSISVALACEAQLLIIDEVIVSGDLNFQGKVIQSIQRLQKDKKIATIICSHVPSALWSLANTFYLLEDGKLKKTTIKTIEELSVNHHIQWHTAFDTFRKIKKVKLTIGAQPLLKAK